MATGAGGKMNNDDPNIKAAVIRDDIERTRADMSRTVNEIEERLSPAHLKEQATSIKDHALNQFREAKDTVKEELSRDIDQVKEKVTGSVHHAKAAVRDATIGRVEHMAYETKRTIVDTIRDNPVPSAMIALGVGWLLMNRNSRSSSHYRTPALGYDDYGATYGYDGRIDAGFEGSFESSSSGSEGRLHGVKQRASHVKQGVKEGASHLVDRAQEAMHRVADEARVLGSEARYEAGRVYRGAGRRVRSTERRVEDTIRDNPLAAGAVLLAVGAAVGLSLPHTQQEDRWMGEAKETLIERGRNMAQDAVQKVADKAEDLAAGVAGSSSGTGSSSGSGSKNDTVKTEPIKPNGSRSMS